MTIVGKVLVFVNLVFSLVVGGLVMMVYLTSTNWEDAYKKKDAQYQAVNADREQLVRERDEDKKEAAARLTGGAATHRGVKGRMAKTIISCTLLRIFQNVIRLADFLEFLFGFRVALVLIRVIFQRQLAVGFFDILRWGRLFNAEYLIKILAHARVLPLSRVLSSFEKKLLLLSLCAAGKRRRCRRAAL